MEEKKRRRALKMNTPESLPPCAMMLRQTVHLPSTEGIGQGTHISPPRFPRFHQSEVGISYFLSKRPDLR